MSAKQSTDAKAWLEEIKGNRRTQIALVALVAVGAFMAYTLLGSSPAKGKGRSKSGTFATGAPLGESQMGQLRPLMNLARLDKAGQMPGEDRMYRDLFIFDMPAPKPPPPPKPLPPQPPPPPKTAEQIAAEIIAAQKASEEAVKPTNLRYIGWFGSETRGKFGAFMKGEEANALKVGELANPRWRLQDVTKDAAIFQNVRFNDLKHRVVLAEASGSGTPGNRVTNEF